MKNENIKVVTYTSDIQSPYGSGTTHGKLSECQTNIMAADFHYDSCRLNEAIKHAKLALDIANKWDFVDERVLAYARLGRFHGQVGCVKAVIRYYNAMIHWSQKNGNKVYEGAAYEHLMNVYLNSTPNNLEEAARCAQRRLELANETGMLEEKAAAYDTIGIILSQQSKFDEALKSHLKSLEMAKSVKDKELEYFAYFNLARVAKQTGKNHDAIQYFCQGIDRYWP